MATMNPFDLLGDDDTGDLSKLIAAQKVAEKAQPPAAQAKQQQPAAVAQAKSAKQLPSKPAQAGRDANNEIGRGGGRGGGRGFGRGRGGGGGGGGFRRDFVSDENSFSNSGFPTGRGAPEDGESGKTSERRGGYGGGPRGAYRGGGRRGGFSNGDVDEGERAPRRTFERRSGTGRGNELKREGSGRGNWGSQNDEFPQVTEEVNESEKILGDEKPAGDGDAVDVDKESPTKEPEEKEPEDKEMTLEEYQKVLEEKKKSLQALKTEERKVDVKEFESMQQISSKKANHDVFIKLGSDKDKKKEAAEKEEKAKKAVPITEFLKPAEGERHFNSGGRGRGRGGRGGSRGGGGGGGGGFGGGSSVRNVPAPSIEDPGQFPTLGAK